MLRNRLIAPAVCFVGTLWMAGCAGTAPTYRPERHARYEPAPRNTYTAFNSGTTEFAAGKATADNASPGSSNIQQASHQTKPPQDLLTRILPVSPPPKGSGGDNEPILAAVARELGIGRLHQTSGREAPRGIVPRVAGRLQKPADMSANDRRRLAPPPAWPQAPETFASTAADRNILEKLHREATGLRTAGEDSFVPAIEERPTVLPHPTELQASPTRFFSPARDLDPGPSPFAKAPATAQLDVPLPRPEVNIPAPPVAQPGTPQNIAKIPGRFYHSDDYRVLSGEVQQFRNTWRLRYARVDEIDQYGGSVILAGDKRFDDLRDGQLIRVQGRIVQNDRGGPIFEVQALESGER